MRKLFLVGMLVLSGVTAHAMETDHEIEVDVMHMTAEEIDAQAGRVWVCSMKFKGVSRGLQVIIGKFRTKAYGTLNCASVHGEKLSRKIKIDIQSYGVGPTIGVGYFKMRGISSQISLFNESPKDILGKYSATQYEGAVGPGLGYFSAFKIGLPQLSYTVSFQILGGIGFKVGMEKMRITALD